MFLSGTGRPYCCENDSKFHAMKNIFVMVLVVLLSACSSKPYIVQYSDEFSGSGDNEVYIVSHGWHTGIVVPASAIQEKLPKLKDRFDDAPYLELGWGDKGFYQANEISSGLTLRAMFWPTGSVMHVVSVPAAVTDYFPNSEVERLCLSHREFTSLLTFITNSFYRDDAGQILALKNGLYGDSQFYQGVGDYYLMNTCNKWTAKGLRSVGMNIDTTFKLTAGSIMSYLEEYNQALAIASPGRSILPLYSAAVCR